MAELPVCGADTFICWTTSFNELITYYVYNVFYEWDYRWKQSHTLLVCDTETIIIDIREKVCESSEFD